MLVVINLVSRTWMQMYGSALLPGCLCLICPFIITQHFSSFHNDSAADSRSWRHLSFYIAQPEMSSATQLLRLRHPLFNKDDALSIPNSLTPAATVSVATAATTTAADTKSAVAAAASTASTLLTLPSPYRTKTMAYRMLSIQDDVLLKLSAHHRFAFLQTIDLQRCENLTPGTVAPLLSNATTKALTRLDLSGIPKIDAILQTVCIWLCVIFLFPQSFLI
jgi:hypothetical protein